MSGINIQNLLNQYQEEFNITPTVPGPQKIFQDNAPIPAQKSLLALQTKNSLWNNLRPPFIPITEDKTNELANKLRDSYGFEF